MIVGRAWALGVWIAAVCGSTAWSQIRLYELAGEVPDVRLGATVAAAGDIDLDGVPDFVVGSSPWLSSHYGVVQVVSGRTGAVLRTLSSSEHDDGFGRAVRVLGDFDGDGVPDVVVGAPTAVAHAGFSSNGLVKAFSGRTGALLWAARPPQVAGTDGFGVELAGVGDIDGDGIQDVGVGTCTERLQDPYVTASVRVLSGRDGAVVRILESCTCAGGAGGFGMSIAGIGDLDGDGVPEILVGSSTVRRWAAGSERSPRSETSITTGTPTTRSEPRAIRRTGAAPGA